MGKKTICALFVILQFIGFVLFTLFVPSNYLDVFPRNLSVEFNSSNTNREIIETLSIKNRGGPIVDVSFFVKGTPKSIIYLDTYNSYLKQLKMNLNYIEENISWLSNHINEMPVSNESKNKFLIGKLKSTIDEINETNLAISNIVFLNSTEHLKFKFALVNIKSNISKSILQINNSTNISIRAANTKIYNSVDNITDSSNRASFSLDKINPNENYILISLLPNSIKRINESEGNFSNIKIIFLNETKIGNYMANIILQKNEAKIMTSIPMTIKVYP